MRRKWLPFIIAAVTLIGLTYFLNNPSHPEIVKAGSSDNVFGWAWSKNIGWISFNCTNTVCWDPNTQELLDYSCLNNSCTNNGGECRSSCEGAWGPNLAKTPEVVWLGASLVYTGGDYIYATMGGARKDFYRYSISNDSWHPLASTTEVVNAGNLVYDGGDYIYSIFWSGANLYRYSISSDEWTFVTTFPGASGLGYNEYGLSLAYVNGYIYVNCSRAGGRCFYRYYISSDSWEQLADAPADFGEGAYIVYTGGDYIYALRGGKTTDFWRYSISNNKWEPLSSVPSKVRYDGCLVYTGGDYIYATVGDSSGGVFYRYSISNDSWESQPSTPEWYAWGSRMTYAKGYIYMFEGNTPTNPKGFWRFRIPVDYGVNIDGTTGKFSGYAWAENIGWIDFAPPGSYPSSPNFSARVDLDGTTCGQIGNICGWARAVSASSSPTEAGGWGGWIKLSGTSTDGTHYGVSLNPATKEFEGWAAGWDDDSTSTAVIGWISFNCKNESWCATSSYQVKVKAALALPPTVSNLSSTFVDPCLQSRIPTLSWTTTAVDPHNYQIQIDTSPSFSSPIIDKKASDVIGSENSWAPPCNYCCDTYDEISFGEKTYYWRVRVYDENGTSTWATSTFTTKENCYPYSDFTISPLNPTVDVVVTFNNNSTCYSEGGCSSYFWDFGNGITSTTSGSPTTTYSSSGYKTVRLRVTDSNGYTCTTTKTFYVGSKLPWWKEIIPF